MKIILNKTNEISTLGGKSKFYYSFSERNLWIQFGNAIKPIMIKNEIIQNVRNRYEESIVPFK